MLTTIASLLYQLALFSIWFVREANPSDFEDLTTLLVVGLVFAIATAITIKLITMNYGENGPPTVTTSSKNKQSPAGG